MTINSQVRVAGPYVGNGAAAIFPFAFKVFQASDLLVVRADLAMTQSTLALGSDYSVTLNTDQNSSPGGVVTLLAGALTTGFTLTLTSALPVVQGLSLPNQGGWFPKNVEDALDRLTILLQQLGLTGLVQALRVPEIGGVPTLPNASSRANNLLGFDSNGNPTAVIPGPSGTATTLALDLASTASAAKGAGQVGFLYSLAYGAGTIGAWLKGLTGSAGTSFLGFIQGGVGAMVRTLQAKLRDQVSVKDFGARGDGLGATPASEGIDIMSAAWNTWDGTLIKTNLAYSPYNVAGVFTPPTAQPFQNTDTWDFIGCQLALWAGYRSVFFPEGRYLINFSTARAGAGLIRIRGQESTIYGAGTFESVVLPLHDASFFASNHVGVTDYYKLLWNYRISGTPSTIHTMSLQGPTAYTAASLNLTLSCGQNMNGVTHRDLWLAAAARGITGDTSTSDSHVKGVTTEFLFDVSIWTDAGSEISVDFCNLWSSANVAGQKGTVALGRMAVTNTRYIEFQAGSHAAASGVFNGNTVRCVTGGAANAVAIAHDAVVVGNDIEGAMGAAMVNIGKDSTFGHNRVKVTSQQAALNLGDSTAGSATNIMVHGNTLIKTDNTAGAQNQLITAYQASVGYTQAATPSLMILGNSHQGNALQTIGTASLAKNTFAGALQAAQFNEAVTLAGDVTGNVVAIGTSAAGSFPVVMPVLGAGSGTGRDQQRLMLVSLWASNGGALLVRGWALYSSSSSGAAVLVLVLGSTATGGTITFGVTGNNPSAAIVNSSGGTASFQASAVALV